ncbi:MAG: hypothetical protein O7167_00530 [Wolbachia endosymbiont of Andrena nigroaenea]|uniref:hypothetical protein n=1 Tax=unclassified Wolbachia TaxID=2640676 RepID=UPI0021F82459|nr:hypothetical protein [Wolbachia endosymbiont (group A) of Andrena hattorfiana]MDX5526372.1 hypothetical protein [Wolbachia endosymbiont of Andrena nigroaenea]
MTDTLTLKEGDIETTAFDNSSFTRVLHDGEWWYVITEVIAFLTGSKNPSDYLKKIKSRDIGLSEGWGHPPLKLKQKVVNRMLIVQMLRGCFVFCSLFLPKELSNLNVGLQKLGMKDYKNMKTLNLHSKESMPIMLQNSRMDTKENRINSCQKSTNKRMG